MFETDIDISAIFGTVYGSPAALLPATPIATAAPTSSAPIATSSAPSATASPMIPTVKAAEMAPALLPMPAAAPGTATRTVPDLLAGMIFNAGEWCIERPDLLEADRWWAECLFDDLPDGGAGCPTCGSINSWVDVIGRQRCGECEAGLLNAGLRFADRAARRKVQANAEALAMP